MIKNMRTEDNEYLYEKIKHYNVDTRHILNKLPNNCFDIYDKNKKISSIKVLSLILENATFFSAFFMERKGNYKYIFFYIYNSTDGKMHMVGSMLINLEEKKYIDKELIRYIKKYIMKSKTITNIIKTYIGL